LLTFARKIKLLIIHFLQKKEEKNYGEWITSENVEREEETVGRLLSCIASATWR
jgi:hypothetical protein